MNPKFYLSSASAAVLMCLGFLVSGCSHIDSADWARDKGDWARIDKTLGDTLGSGTIDKRTILAAWGDPLARRTTPAGEQMLWLWKRDVSGPWAQSDEGWELLLSFDDRGNLTDRRWGSYRTSVTIGNVMAVTRKVGYSNTAQLLSELGLGGQQHGLDTEGTTLFGYRLSLQLLGYTHRERVILRYQNTVRSIAEAASILEAAATVENRSAPSEQEVFQYLTRNIQRQVPPSGSLRGAIPGPVDSIYLDDLVGSGLVWQPGVNAYGPWINSDPTRRPFIWQPISEDPLALL
jgi:hypothetical protein